MLTTNGTKSYGVMIYRCDDLGFSDTATIGYYAPTTAAYTHSLSNTGVTDEIACIHISSEWSNIIFELEISNHILEMTPEPHFATGDAQLVFRHYCGNETTQPLCYIASLHQLPILLC